MKKALLNLWVCLCVLAGTNSLVAQTTITCTSPTPAWWSTSSSTIVFGVGNTNSYPIILTDLSNYAPAGHTATYTLWYHPTIVTGVPTAISAANGWIQVPVSYTVPTTGAAGVVPIFSGINLTIPGNIVYRLALVASQNGPWYGASGSTGNVFSAGGVEIYAQTNPISPTYVGYFPGPPNNTPRSFFGTLTFKPATDNDVSGVAIANPLNGSQHCPGDLLVRVAIKNTGVLPQSNFPVSANYTGSFSGTFSGVYTGTLNSGVTDTVDILGTFQPGNYTMKAFTVLATDTLEFNDTTPAASFVIKPNVPLPITYSDTVCAGGNAQLSVDQQTNTTYNWFSAPSGGVLVNVGTTLSFLPLTQDTMMYVSAVLNGCESSRVPISAAFGPPPVVNLGPDTSFCESIPLVLDAGNAGGDYLWSSGDTVQSISITNQSGKIWVTVDKYCLASDTIIVTISPLPVVGGISYVRMNGTYQFSPSGGQYINSYLWYFGDGTSSTEQNPLHAYSHGQTSALDVMLIVGNECGYDTVYRSVPTDVTGIEANSFNVEVYPNPASNTLVVSSEKASLSEITIVDLPGRLALKSVCSGGTKESIDISSLTTGSYLVRISTEKGQLSRKLVIRR